MEVGCGEGEAWRLDVAVSALQMLTHREAGEKQS